MANSITNSMKQGVKTALSLVTNSPKTPFINTLHPLNGGQTGGVHTDALLTIKKPSNVSSTRSMFTTAINYDFKKDVMFGGAGGKIAEEAKKWEASTDGMCFNDQDAGTPALENYMAAHREVRGEGISEKDAIKSRPWVELKFADRNLVEDDPFNDPAHPEAEATRFVEYARQAVKTALERDGKVFFTISGWSPLLYQQQALAAEIEHEMPYAKYLNSGNRPIPRITNMEIGDMNELGGGMEKVPVTYLSASGKTLDSDQFKALFLAASKACRTSANLERMRANIKDLKPRDDSYEEFRRCREGRESCIQTFQFDPEATKALKDLQDFIT